MRVIPIVLLSFAMVGCGGISKKDLQQSEANCDSKLAQTAAELDRKITAIDTKYANVLALDQEVKNGLQRMDGNAKLLEASKKTVDESIANMLKILQAQRNALKEQARSVEDQIAALQKSPPGQ